MPMRSGKTKVAIDFLCICHIKWHTTRILVVCPLSVVGVWKRQIAIHMPDEYKSKVKILIINYEKTYDRDFIPGTRSWDPSPRKSLLKWLGSDTGRPLIIVDEAHKIGKPTTLQSKYLWNLKKETGAIPLTLTGTPFHRKPLMVYGIFRFIDDLIFPWAWTKFKNRYAKWGGYGNVLLLRYRRQRELIRKISPWTFMMKTLPVVPPQHEEIPFVLHESEKTYAKMAEEAIVLFSNGATLEAPIALTKVLRLSQICGGRVRDSEGSMRRLGREKRQAFASLVGDQFVENDVDKFVVFARFVPELKDICEVCRDAGYRPLLMYGKTPGHVRERRLLEFDEAEDKVVFVAQASTGSLGIDLSAAAITVFYSLPSSLVDYDQDCARIRKYKDKRTLTYYYLCAEGTIEEVQLSSLRANLNLIEVLERDPELLNYEARG